MTGKSLFRRRIHAANADAESLLSNANLDPDERMRVQRALNSLRAVANAEQLLVIPVDAEKMLAEAEVDIIKLVVKLRQPSSHSEP